MMTPVFEQEIIRQQKNEAYPFHQQYKEDKGIKKN